LHAGVLWQQQPPVLHVENVRFSGQNFQIVGELFYYPQGASERLRGRGGAENDPEHATKRTGAAIGSKWTWFWVVSTAGSVREPDSALCYRIVNPVRFRGRRHGSPRVPAQTTVARRLYSIGMGLGRLSSKNGDPEGRQTHLVGIDARHAFDVKIGAFSAPVRAVHANRH